MQQSVIVKNWSVWPPLGHVDGYEHDQQTLLSEIPLMIRRRLTPLAKIVFCAIRQCMEMNQSIPSVFSSTHGELAKSFAMMEMIEQGEEISPTTFSLAVHNSIAGLFSMVFQNNAESTVIAPGEEGIIAALLEVMGMLQEGEEEVLLVYYDEPIVPFYPYQPYRLTLDSSMAMAFLITAEGKGQSLTLSDSDQIGNDGEQPVQVPKLVELMNGLHKQLTFNTPRHRWNLTLN